MRTTRARPWAPSWLGWGPGRGDPSGARPARPDQAAHRRLRRCDRVLLPVGVSHHHPVGPRAPSRQHRSAGVLPPARGAPLPGAGDRRGGDDRGAARQVDGTSMSGRLRTRWRSPYLHDEPLRLERPLFATKDYFNYTWSLSVEEQFYLLWPFALLWGYRRNPRLFARSPLWLIGFTLALDLYLGTEPTGEVRPARVLRERHECAAHPCRRTARDRLSTVGCLGGSTAGALRVAGLALLPVLALSERHPPSLAGDRRGDRH